MSSNIKHPPKNSSRPSLSQSSSSSTSESVKRGAQLFQERLRKQQNYATKNISDDEEDSKNRKEGEREDGERKDEKKEIVKKDTENKETDMKERKKE